MMCFAWTKLIFFDFLLGKKSNGLSLRNSTKLALRDVLLGVSLFFFFFFFFFFFWFSGMNPVRLNLGPKCVGSAVEKR